MSKIESLTAEQQAIVTATRDAFFSAATSTETDRAKAEAAIAVIVAPALAKHEIHWAASTTEAAWLRASLWDSLSNSLRASLWDPLWDSLRASLRASLWASLWDSLSDSLRDSLWAWLRASLRASLSNSLSNSLWDSLRDSGWTAFYLAPIRAGVATVAPDLLARLEAFESLSQSAFSIWVLPGHVIALEKPKSVRVENGKLADISW